MFVIAESALSQHKQLKKVLIMKATPRFDPISSDPLQIKPSLVQVFNCALIELLFDSVYKDRIAIVEHNLDCSGGVQQARFRDSVNNKYDGIHLFGPSGRKAYTTSILDALKSNGLIQDRLTSHELFMKHCDISKKNKPRIRQLNVNAQSKPNHLNC